MEALSHLNWDRVVQRVPVRRVVQATAVVVGLAALRKFATRYILAVPVSERTKAAVVSLNAMTCGGKWISSDDFPDLPVSKLGEGLERYVRSVEHLHTPEQMDALRAVLKDRKLKVAHAMVVAWAIHCAGWVTAAKHFYRFMSEQPSFKEGWQLLQEAGAILSEMEPSSIGLEVKSSNWLRAPWYRMAYLQFPMIDTMWYGNIDKVPQSVEGDHPVAVRAAYMLHAQMLLWEDKLKCGRRELAPQMPLPLDTWQYGHLGHVEHAGPKHNMLQDNRGKRGVVIVSNGIPCYVEKVPRTPQDCYALIRAIQERTSGMSPQKVNILTWMSGAEGHDAWEKLCGLGENRRLSELLRSRVFTLHLSDKRPSTLIENAHEVFGPQLLDKWGGGTVACVAYPDKSLSYSSHAACEATAVAYTKMHAEGVARRYGGVEGKELVLPDLAGKGGVAVDFTPLVFETDGTVDSCIARVEEELGAHLSKRDIHVGRYPRLNKERIKACKFSPDFVMQFAIQLAFYRTFKRFTKTYQTMTTRTFHEGRTDTLRPCTQEMKAAVEAFCLSTADDTLKMDSLNEALKEHSAYKMMNMEGRGFERTLQAMLAFTSGTDHEPELFQTDVWKSDWDLVTSQTPTSTVGGGYVPWTKDGFSVSYKQGDKDEMVMHVQGNTDRSHGVTAEAFAATIAQGMEEVLAFLETH